jgi:hypothetical protein
MYDWVWSVEFVIRTDALVMAIPTWLVTEHFDSFTSAMAAESLPELGKLSLIESAGDVAAVEPSPPLAMPITTKNPMMPATTHGHFRAFGGGGG